MALPHNNDLESGLSEKPRPVQRVWNTFMRRVTFESARRGTKNNAVARGRKQTNEKQGLQIEDYRNGYPRFSALTAAHVSFRIYRRFSILRARLLLHAQDEVVQLEENLHKLDQHETQPLFLSSSRRDGNSERKEILNKLHEALKSYDELLERNHRIEAYKSPDTRHVQDLKNWLAGNASLVRNEIQFLDRSEDLLVYSNSSHGAIAGLEESVEYILKSLNIRPSKNASRDLHVHLYPRTWTKRAARALITPLIIILLLAPVIICNSITSLNVRLAVMVLATSAFITTLSLLTAAQTVELVVAGATYTTVLIVFITGPN